MNAGPYYEGDRDGQFRFSTLAYSDVIPQDKQRWMQID